MKLINDVLRCFGHGFANSDFSLLLRIKCVFLQKLLGFNRNVPWPVHWTSKVNMPSKIDPGTRSPGLSMGCHIDGRNGIKFGSNVWVGPRVSIISMNHDVNNYHKYLKQDEVKIGDNCWLAANSVILPGVELGEHTIVAAGCVVNKSFPEGNQLLAGVPAKVVKKLDAYQGE
jgi:serine acetyltransferase